MTAAPDLEPLYAAVREALREAERLDDAAREAARASDAAEEAANAATVRLQDARLALRRAGGGAP